MNLKITSGILKLIASRLFLLAILFSSIANAQNIQPLKALNSPYDEQHPVLSPTGELFFSVGFHPENSGGPTDSGDIWMSKKDGDSWAIPVRVNSLSTAGNDVVVGFSDALTIIVYHSGVGKKQGLHQYSRFGNSWNYLRALDMGNFKNLGNHFSGRLSQDGQLIIMAMTSFGSYGNEDIYVSFKKTEGQWSSPFNLGPQVNSSGQEQTPYLTEDQQTLYFSSNSQANGKGKDIYYVQRTGDGWEQWTSPKPVELVNTRGAELSYAAISPNKELAIFTSTQNSEGFGDFMQVAFEKIEVLPLVSNVEPPKEIEKAPLPVISEQPVKKEVEVSKPIESPKPVQVIEAQQDSQVKEIVPQKVESPKSNLPALKVLDSQDRHPLDYLITLTGNRGERKQVLDQAELDGLLGEQQWNTIIVSSKGYISENYSPSQWDELEDRTVLLRPAKAGTGVVLQNIQFNRGTSDFADTRSIQLLDNLVAFMKENPEIKIRLEGHTDNAGDPSLNKDLSMKRASKIRGYLTLNGVDFERIRISGWGGTKPVADNNTEEGRNLNRRVEMWIEQ